LKTGKKSKAKQRGGKLAYRKCGSLERKCRAERAIAYEKGGHRYEGRAKVETAAKPQHLHRATERSKKMRRSYSKGGGEGSPERRGKGY